MPDKLEHSHFEGKEGAAFQAQTTEHSVNLELVEIHKHDREHTQGFTLLFRGPDDQKLPQGMVRVAHDAVGEHEIFITPVHAAPRETGVVHYEAVFDRLKEDNE